MKLEEIKNRDRVISLQEFSMAKSLNAKLLAMCQEGDWSRVRHVVIKIGAAREIDPELLGLAFTVVSKGTLTEGASLSVLFLPIIFTCHACKREFDFDFDAVAAAKKMGQHLGCPVCGSQNLVLKSGNELVIEFLEVEKHLPWHFGGFGGAGNNGTNDDGD